MELTTIVVVVAGVEVEVVSGAPRRGSKRVPPPLQAASVSERTMIGVTRGV